MLHSIIFFFCLLLLAQRNALIAYALLPLLCGAWLSFNMLYDCAGAFLHTHTISDAIATTRVNQHFLRSIYGITPGLCLAAVAGFCVLYGFIFSMRRYLRPVILLSDTSTWIIAGVYTSVSLLILPFGIICP